MRFRRARPGEPITAERWNELLDALELALRITAASPLMATQDRTGTHLSLALPRHSIHAVLDEELDATGVADFTPSGPVTASVYDGPPTAAGVATGEKVQIYWWSLRSGPLMAGAYVTADFENGYYWGRTANC